MTKPTPPGSGLEAVAVRVFLQPGGRLPGFAPRRLVDLIEEIKVIVLTANEQCSLVDHGYKRKKRLG